MVSRHRYLDPMGFVGAGDLFAGFSDGLVEAFVARPEYLSESDTDGDPYGIGLGASVRRWRGAYAGNVAIQTGALNACPTFIADGELGFDGDDRLDLNFLASTLQGTHSLYVRWFATNSSIQRSLVGAGRSTTSTPFYQAGHQGNEDRGAIRVRNNSGAVSTLGTTAPDQGLAEAYREDIFRLDGSGDWTLQTLDAPEVTVANPGPFTFDRASIGAMPFGSNYIQYVLGRVEALLFFDKIISEAEEAAASSYLDSLQG